MLDGEASGGLSKSKALDLVRRCVLTTFWASLAKRFNEWTTLRRSTQFLCPTWHSIEDFGSDCLIWPNLVQKFRLSWFLSPVKLKL